MNVHYRYFNLSRWILAYFRTGPNSYGYPDNPTHAPAVAFTAARVRAYSAMLEGLLNPGPLSAAVFTSPDAANQNLTYVDSPAPLFTNPVGGGANDPSDDGLTTLSRFWAAFQPLLVAQPFPLFCVIDHDGGHNVTALLARQAFTNSNSVGARRARLLISFDYHADWGNNRADGAIRCSTWANYVVKSSTAWTHPSAPAGPFADAYLWLGYFPRNAGTPDWSQNKLFIPGHPRYNQFKSLEQANPAPPPPTQPVANFPAVIQAASSAIMQTNAQPNGIDVYVTCDRDFIRGSQTPWTEGAFTPAAGMAGIQQCLLALQAINARLVGFDVTGLPVPNGSQWGPNTDEPAWSRANADVQQCYQFVTQY